MLTRRAASLKAWPTKAVALTPYGPRCCGTGSINNNSHKDDSANGAGEEATFTPKVSPSQARCAELPKSSVQTFTRLQRGALGSVGAAMASAGLGGLAWLHWPILGPSSLCAVASGCGVACLCLAARGSLPQQAKKAEKPKRILELKLLNEQHRLQGESEALRKLLDGRTWPAPVQMALQNAAKSEQKAKKEEAVEIGKNLLAEVKAELAQGGTSESVKQRLRPRLYVFDFNASQELSSQRPQSMKARLELLSTAVTFILASASKNDEALLRLTSPGGGVSTYGLAASQLQRLREAEIPLTIAVDQCAASGGYMMACVANRIVAAPFAQVGSIGVIAGLPNFHKVLERNEIEFQQVTAGKYKRTVNVLTPTTEEGLTKFKEEVNEIHLAFQDHIKQFRPQMDVAGLATGEVWLGTAALKKGLIDAVETSDDFLRRKVLDGYDAVELSQAKKERQGIAKLLEGFGGSVYGGVDALASRLSDVAASAMRRWQGKVSQPRVEADLHS